MYQHNTENAVSIQMPQYLMTGSGSEYNTVTRAVSSARPGLMGLFDAPETLPEVKEDAVEKKDKDEK